MARILVYNNDTNRMFTFNRNLDQPMPYNSGGTLTVREFRGGSNSNTLWTSLRCMEAWNSFRYLYGRGIFVGFAFKRPWEGGHSRLSQHYAGLAFDAGQNLSSSRKKQYEKFGFKLWNLELCRASFTNTIMGSFWWKASFGRISSDKTGSKRCLCLRSSRCIKYSSDLELEG